MARADSPDLSQLLDDELEFPPGVVTQAAGDPDADAPRCSDSGNGDANADNSASTDSSLVNSKDYLEDDFGHVAAGVRILGLRMSRFRRRVQFAICAGGMLGTFVLYGVLLEAIFVKVAPALIEDAAGNLSTAQLGVFVTFCQFVVYSVCAACERIWRREFGRHAPLPLFAVIGFFMMSAITLANASLAFLNYPTQMIFKSCKLVPVMIGGAVILKRGYAMSELVSALLLIAGLLLMTLGNMRVSPNFDPFGVLLCMGSLFSDAFVSNLQERHFKTHAVSHSEMIAYTYSFGALYLFIGLVFSRSFWAASTAVLSSPIASGSILLFSLCGFVGVSFAVATIKLFSAFVSTTVASCRKFLSIVVSFFLFSKPFSWAYLIATALAAFGVGIQIHAKDPEVLPHLLALATGRPVHTRLLPQ